MPGPTAQSQGSCVRAATDETGRRLAFGIADAVQVMHSDARLRDGVFDDLENPLPMMCSCVAGKETFPGWCDVGMPNVCKHG